MAPPCAVAGLLEGGRVPSFPALAGSGHARRPVRLRGRGRGTLPGDCWRAGVGLVQASSLAAADPRLASCTSTVVARGKQPTSFTKTPPAARPTRAGPALTLSDPTRPPTRHRSGPLSVRRKKAPLAPRSHASTLAGSWHRTPRPGPGRTSHLRAASGVLAASARPATVPLPMRLSGPTGCCSRVFAPKRRERWCPLYRVLALISTSRARGGGPTPPRASEGPAGGLGGTHDGPSTRAQKGAGSPVHPRREKTTAPRVPAWSPTVVLTGRHSG